MIAAVAGARLPAALAVAGLTVMTTTISVPPSKWEPVSNVLVAHPSGIFFLSLVDSAKIKCHECRVCLKASCLRVLPKIDGRKGKLHHSVNNVLTIGIGPLANHTPGLNNSICHETVNSPATSNYFPPCDGPYPWQIHALADCTTNAVHKENLPLASVYPTDPE